MLKGFLETSGFLVLKLIYGKHIVKCKINGLLMSVINVIWMLMVVIFLSEKDSSVLELIFGWGITIAYPVFCLVWGILIRKKYGAAPEINLNAEQNHNSNYHSVKYCRRCGANLSGGEKTCPHCGTEIIREDV